VVNDEINTFELCRHRYLRLCPARDRPVTIEIVPFLVQHLLDLIVPHHETDGEVIRKGYEVGRVWDILQRHFFAVRAQGWPDIEAL
jgi:hypothetical protein